MNERNEETLTTAQNSEAKLDIASMSYQARTNHILAIRQRILEDPSSVPTDDIRDAVKLIRLNRAESPRGKKPKPSTKAVTLEDF